MTSSEEHGRAPLAVTTSGKLDDRVIALARGSAQACGLTFVERRRKAPLRPMLDRVDALLVFERKAVVLCDREGSLRFSPGMARLRIKRLQAQVREDRLLDLAAFQPGDSVLDCTLGLAGDALVAAYAVGPTGSVVGLEKSLAIYALVSSGLPAFEAPEACRIDVRHADAAEFLARQPDRSFDAILFDPMFDRPRRCSPAFEILRRHAEHAPLTSAALEDARRVARRIVLVKGPRYSTAWKRLGLQPEQGSPHSQVCWARLTAG